MYLIKLLFVHEHASLKQVLWHQDNSQATVTRMISGKPPAGSLVAAICRYVSLANLNCVPPYNSCLLYVDSIINYTLLLIILYHFSCFVFLLQIMYEYGILTSKMTLDFFYDCLAKGMSNFRQNTTFLFVTIYDDANLSCAT